VIILTRLGNGMEIAVNPDLIERAEHTPDTVLTLVDGHKLVVQEPLDEVVSLIRAWRASVAAEALLLTRQVTETGQHATVFPGNGAAREPLRDGKNEVQDAVQSDRAAHSSPFGRVLRLPARGV
jgi:flagellar protein FlbD